MQRAARGIKHYMQTNGTCNYFHCIIPPLRDTIVVFFEHASEKFHTRLSNLGYIASRESLGNFTLHLPTHKSGAAAVQFSPLLCFR